MTSTKSNVHPGQYKVAGRERQGEDIVHEQEKQSMAQEQARLGRQKKAKPGPARSRSGKASGRADAE